MNKEKLSGGKIIIYTPELDFKVGGILVLHNLAKELANLGCNVMLSTMNGKKYQNEFCNNFAATEDIDENTIVLYPEIIEGNPLNAKYVVRWILCDLGVNCRNDIYNTWGKDDLVFHYSPFLGKYDSYEVDLLYTIWINPAIKNKNLLRDGSCYLFKKATKFHRNIKLIHPADSVLIDNYSIEKIIEIFNHKKYFYCYDPYSFYESMAALCGCIPIVYPIEGMNKLEWLKTKGLFQVYLDKRDNVSGIAYGADDIQYASDTLQRVWEEKLEAIEFGRKTIAIFIDKADDYFVNNQKKYQFKTVGKMINIWKQCAQQNNFFEIKRKDQEIELMKSSKFWKLREKFVFLKKIIK